MGLFNAIKRAFGFGDEDSLYTEEYDASTAIYAADSPQEETPAVEPPTPPVFRKAETPATCVENTDTPTAGNDELEGESGACAEQEKSPSCPEETAGDHRAAGGKRQVACSIESLPADLFDAVIELFNDFQPEFVRQCLSVDKERQFIMASLSERLESVTPAPAVDEASAERIAELESIVAARDHTINEDRRYRDSLERQKANLLEHIEVLEGSAQRQRALALKPLDETQQPAQAETETEVATAAEKAPEALPEAEATPQAPEAITEPEESEEMKQLKAEVERQTAMREQLELKSRMADKMLTDLRNTAAASRRELEEARAAHEAELAALTTEHQSALAEIEREQNEAAQNILAQLSEFEGVKNRLESRIAELKESLKTERERAKRLSDEVGSLRSTIETNLYNQANSEMRLRSEIKQLRSQIAPAASAADALASDGEAIYQKLSEAARDRRAAATKVPEVSVGTPDTDDAGQTPAAPEPLTITAEPVRPDAEPDETAVLSPEPPKRRRGRPRKHEYETELDNPTGFMPGGRKDDPEFGYHEPPRRPTNDSAAQLSLF